MHHHAFFQIHASAEQLAYARQLVEYSMQHHRIPNIWDGTVQQARTVELRFTGSLGEVLFADAYQLQRPVRSFGAADGQDWGKDFELFVDGVRECFDVKTMRRKTDRFRSGYVLNIPASQLNRPGSLTDCYFHINLHKEAGGLLVASFVGFVAKEDIRTGRAGQFYASGASRIRADGTCFPFHTDTYEVDLADLNTPPLNDFIRGLPGFAIRSWR